MKKSLLILSGIAFLGLGAFFAMIVGWLFAVEVWPVIRQGSLSIESSTRILNILWEGNELYVLLAAYTLLAGGLTYAAVQTIRAACRKQQQ